MHFRQPFDPLKTRELYETMEKTGEEQFCRIVEKGVDDPYVMSVLETAREHRNIVDKCESWRIP